FHFMGIGGQGISAIAQMAQQAGSEVTGCDRQASATTRALEKAGIAVQIGHSADHLTHVDTLVISPAVPALDPTNAELLAAQRLGLRIVSWQELLGELMRGKCVLSVSGVHGKGTTTSMLALMLVEAGLDPTCEIGAVVPRWGVNYRLGQSQYFVNEADEFNHNFWHYHPRLAVVKSIEFEHPEFFADYEAFLYAFEHFVRGMDMQSDWPLPPTLVLNAGSAGCLELRQRLQDWPGRVITYAVDGTPADFTAYAINLDGETSFRVRTRARGEMVFPPDLVLHLQLPGLHNVENALAALVAAHLVAVPADVVARTLAGFEGTRRRFEIRNRGPLFLNGEERDVILVDDYAHHPTAIAATLEAARRRYLQRRLVAVYQPHMYSRTRVFFEQFLLSFDVADVVLIADIFPARERDSGLVHSRDLVAAMTQRPHFAQGPAQVLYSGDVEQTIRMLQSILRSGDLAVIMGAGDIYNVTEQLLQESAQYRS
ncbi:MAG: UDP-N-acetylmuramate--L-alanine ligase, partial [Ktedonobacteraceae bacterium]|nr:UDP-N-acetylmuramate--L-alanine ligase [Ktedonobacteraceae bacterium]